MFTHEKIPSTGELTRDTQTIKLDVGGVLQESYYGTLKESPYLRYLIVGDMAKYKLVKCHIFIDRSGMLFSHVLQFLRTRKVFTEDKTLLLQLKMEAEFYQLDKLGDTIQQKLDMLESEGKNAYRFMNPQELAYVHLNKQTAASSTTLNSAVTTHQQETFKVLNIVTSYSKFCTFHNRTNCGCNMQNNKIAQRQPMMLVSKRDYLS